MKALRESARWAADVTITRLARWNTECAHWPWG